MYSFVLVRFNIVQALVYSIFHALQCWKFLNTADSIPEETFVHAKLVHAHGQDIF